MANWLPRRRIASINALPSPLPYSSPKSESPIAVVRRASGASSPTHEAYFIRISFTVFSSPRRSMSSRNARTFRGGTHHASSEVSTSFLFSSGTCSQNSWSNNSAYDCTESPACDIISSCVEGIWRLRRESRQRLLQRVLRPHRHRAQARLERRHVHAVLRIFPRFAQLREQSQHRTNVFFLDAESAARSCSPSYPRQTASSC